jgi:hypothetical protein
LSTGGVKRRVVPEFDTELRNMLLEKYHGEKHAEYQKTFNQIYESYIGIKKLQVKEYVDNCEKCSKGSGSIKLPMFSGNGQDIVEIPRAFKPWDYVLVDIIDLSSYSQENDGFSYILLVVDIFSKFLFSFALITNEVLEITNNIFNVCLREGIPRVIHGGTSFDSSKEVIDELSKLFKVNTISVGQKTSYSEDFDQAERATCITGARFAKLLWDKEGHLIHRRWIDVLPGATFAYNLAVHSVHNMTPFKAFRGRDPNNIEKPKKVETTTSNANQTNLNSSISLNNGMSLSGNMNTLNNISSLSSNLGSTIMGSGSIGNGNIASSGLANLASLGNSGLNSLSSLGALNTLGNYNSFVNPAQYNNSLGLSAFSKIGTLEHLEPVAFNNSSNEEFEPYPFQLESNFDDVYKELQRYQNSLNTRVQRRTESYYQRMNKENQDDNIHLLSDDGFMQHISKRKYDDIEERY